MKALVFLGFLTLGACVAPGYAARGNDDDSSNSCVFDSECGGGSCRFGQCSVFPPDSTPSASMNSCTFDSDCMGGGSCLAGSCSPN